MSKLNPFWAIVYGKHPKIEFAFTQRRCSDANTALRLIAAKKDVDLTVNTIEKLDVNPDFMNIKAKQTLWGRLYKLHRERHG